MNFSSKKKILALAIANGLLAVASQNVSAVVDLDSTTPAPIKFASEIVIDDTSPGAAGLSAGASLDANATVGFGLADATTYYSRFELDNTAALLGVGSTVSNIGTSASGVFQSAVTVANIANVGVTHSLATVAAVATTDVIQFNGFTGILPKNKSDINLKYSLYETAATSVSGGATGLLATKVNKFITFASAVNFSVIANSAPLKIDVSLDSKKFEGGKTTVHLGDVTIAPTAGVLLADGNAATLGGTMANIVGTATTLTVAGDFAAADSDKTKVFLSDAACTPPGVASNTVTATEAVFNVGSDILTANGVCFTASTATAMTGGTYSVTYAPALLTAGTVKYQAATQAADLGTVKKNGTTLQTMFFTNTAGYVPRFYLTNTGGTAAPYSISVQTDATSTGGLVPLAAAATGSIPAGSGLLLKAADIIESGQRGTVIFSISAPPANINGLFQVRNQTSGDFDSYTMQKD